MRDSHVKTLRLALERIIWWANLEGWQEGRAEEDAPITGSQYTQLNRAHLEAHQAAYQLDRIDHRIHAERLLARTVCQNAAYCSAISSDTPGLDQCLSMLADTEDADTDTAEPPCTTTTFPVVTVNRETSARKEAM